MAAGCWLVVLVGLSAVTLALFAYPLSHFFSPMSFNYSEGWNSYWDEAARLGRSLYAAPPDLSITNYPPVSFHLIGLLSHVFGGVNTTGRIVALFCLGWSAVNIMTAAAALAGSWRGGIYAALCFLLWLALLTPGRIGTNDPHFLGLALATVGACAYLRAEGRAAWIVAAAVFFATSMFVKNNLLAFPLATALHLIITRQGRSFVVFAGAGVLVAGLFLALTLVVDGPFFFAHLLAPRAFSRADGIESISAFYTYFYAPMLISIGWLLWSQRPATGFAALCLVCSALLAAVFGFGNGVANNVHYETLAAMAIVAGAAVTAVQQGLAAAPRGWIAFAVVALLTVSSALVRAPTELYGALGRSARLPQRQTEYEAATAFIKAAPGPALCESLLMCFEAGKPFGYDPYYVKDQMRIGRVPEARIVGDLNARRYAAIEIGEDDAGFSLGEGERLRFSAGVMDAILANYRVGLQSPYFAVLVPK